MGRGEGDYTSQVERPRTKDQKLNTICVNLRELVVSVHKDERKESNHLRRRKAGSREQGAGSK